MDRVQRRLLPLADLIMALMWSRPGGLSLQTAWVTPATLFLATAVLLAGIPLGAVGLIFGIRAANLPLIIGGLLCVALSFGAGVVALFGLRQRLIRP